MNLIGSLLGSSAGLQLLSVRAKRGFTPEGGTIFVPNVVIEESHVDETVVTDHPVERGSMVSDHAINLPAEITITCGWSNSPTGLLDEANGGAAGQSLLKAMNIDGTTPLAQNAISQAIPVANSLYNSALNSSPLLNGIATVATGADAARNWLSSMNGTANVTNYINQVYGKVLQAKQGRALFEVMTGKRLYQNMLITMVQTTTDGKTEHAMILRITFRELVLVSTATYQVRSETEVAGNVAGIPTDCEQNGVQFYPVHRGTVEVRQLASAAKIASF